jgi:hypothetical protein
MSDDEPCPRDSGAVYRVGLANRCGTFWTSGPLTYAAALAELRAASAKHRGTRHAHTAYNTDRVDCDTNGLTSIEEEAFGDAWSEGRNG